MIKFGGFLIFIYLCSRQLISIMNKIYVMLFAAGFSTMAAAQEKFELGKPNDSNYRYLDEYKGLKEYIDYSKYPNFKLGAGTTVNDYLNNTTVKNLTNKNFTETVAGNAMKMASCVDNNGNMNFTTVKSYVKAATEAGLNVYGHTLAWHSQQPVGWLTKIISGKPDPNSEQEYTEVASKDFRTSQNVGWSSDKTQYGYTITFDATNGLKVHTTKTCDNSWDVQFVAIDNVVTEVDKSCKMTITMRGSKAGTLHSKLGDFSYTPSTAIDIPFTTEWQDIQVDYTPVMDTNFLLLQCGDFVGDIYIKSIKFEGYKGKTVALTDQERKDTLIWAMDKWIKGMMEACDGKVKAWDLVNEAIGGGGDDGQGNYVLQSSKQSNSGSWDVGGSNFFWQDYLGDLDYVRQACRLARKYGPEDVKLFINDYNLEGTWDIVTKNGVSASKKVWSIVNWIKKWEADGVTKIDGIGTQMHISYYENSGSLSGLKKAITGMFTVMANSGKLVRVSEMDMGYVNASGSKVLTANMTEEQHKKMADFYEWILKEFFRIVPPAQQWGICQWCTTDAPDIDNMWRRNEPVGIWDLNYNRKHVYAGFVRGLGGVVSGIDGVKADEAVNTSKGIYNLNGMRMQANSLEDLPKGLYIVNGKKVVK